MIRDYTDREAGADPGHDGGPEAVADGRPVGVPRASSRVPKMIINGTNDPYWPLDALNTYWDDLKGEKWLLYVPNAGHDLRETDKDGKKELLPTRAVNTLAAFASARSSTSRCRS